MSDYYWDVVTISRNSEEKRHDLGTDSPLNVGDVIPLNGDAWLIDAIEPGGAAGRPRVTARPVSYRLILRSEEGDRPGDFSDHGRHRPDVGYRFTAEGTTYEITERRFLRGADGQPFIEFVALPVP